MDQPVTIGLDLAKSVFQVHGVGADGTVVVRRQLRRAQVLAFLFGWGRASWAWRPARGRITGHGN